MKDNLKIVVISDFDGTITNQDSLTILLDHFVSEDWRNFEDKYEKREITGREALEKEMELLTISIDKAEEFLLERVELDEEFLSFSSWARENDIPIEIVSCNFHQLIYAQLEKYNLGYLPVKSNSLFEKDGTLHVKPGNPMHPECKDCHHCKVLTVREYRKKGFYTIYCGDGLTDRCAAWEADYLFAKSRLQKWMNKHDYPYEYLKDYGVVSDYVKKVISGEISPESNFRKQKRVEQKNPFENTVRNKE